MDVVVENENILVQPCNVWAGKRFSIDEYKKVIKNIQDVFVMYNIEKNALKQRSLQLTNKKIRVSHLTIPGINDGS